MQTIVYAEMCEKLGIAESTDKDKTAGQGFYTITCPPPFENPVGTKPRFDPYRISDGKLRTYIVQTTSREIALQLNALDAESQYLILAYTYKRICDARASSVKIQLDAERKTRLVTVVTVNEEEGSVTLHIS